MLKSYYEDLLKDSPIIILPKKRTYLATEEEGNIDIGTPPPQYFDQLSSSNRPFDYDINYRKRPGLGLSRRAIDIDKANLEKKEFLTSTGYTFFNGADIVLASENYIFSTCEMIRYATLTQSYIRGLDLSEYLDGHLAYERPAVIEMSQISYGDGIECSNNFNEMDYLVLSCINEYGNQQFTAFRNLQLLKTSSYIDTNITTTKERLLYSAVPVTNGIAVDFGRCKYADDNFTSVLNELLAPAVFENLEPKMQDFVRNCSQKSSEFILGHCRAIIAALALDNKIDLYSKKTEVAK